MSSKYISTTSNKTRTHYEGHSADSYEGAFFYEPGGYTQYLCSLVKNRLLIDHPPLPSSMSLNISTPLFSSTDQNQPQRLLLDIGGGTGNFTNMLIQDIPNLSAIVVDPFLEKGCNSQDDNNKITFVTEPAEAFLEPVVQPEQSWRLNYDYVLLKEVAHHLAEQDRVPIFRGIWHGLRPRSGPTLPSLLLITRPKYNIDYPLWDAAKKVWANNQPSLEQFVLELNQAGFTNVQHTLESYPCSIALERWQSMIRSRFWSTFSNFSNDELDIACHTIAETEKDRISADGIISFDDRLIFISATKFS